jgi:hypothetical protein
MMVTFGQSSGPIDPIAPVLLSQKGSLYLTRPFLFIYFASRAELLASAAECSPLSSPARSASISTSDTRWLTLRALMST